MSSPQVGELFLLGFRGTHLPEWLVRFEGELGLGGVILFDLDVETGDPERNIRDPEQLRALCAEIHALPSRPLVFVDQEGGPVRRLRPERGFAPLPSASEFCRLSESEREGLARASYREMSDLGIDFNLSPVVDLNTNPESPAIGALGRSFSDDADEVRRNVAILARVAHEVGLGLCLKHYPGLGGARTDPHNEPTDLTGQVSDRQLRLFTELWDTIPGRAILLSHGIVGEWEARVPTSVSEPAVATLRSEAREALLITDDLQMRGIQLRYRAVEASVRALRAGVDLLCLANNERAREPEASECAHEIARLADADPQVRENLVRSLERVRARKERRCPEARPRGVGVVS